MNEWVCFLCAVFRDTNSSWEYDASTGFKDALSLPIADVQLQLLFLICIVSIMNKQVKN